MPLTFISTDKAPLPAGHYSQGVVANSLIFVATQLPIIPGLSSVTLPDTPEDQTRQALENAIAVVEAGGGNKSTVVRVTLYLANISHWDAVNKAYASVMGSCRPPRGMVPVSSSLHYGALIGVDVIAVRS